MVYNWKHKHKEYLKVNAWNWQQLLGLCFNSSVVLVSVQILPVLAHVSTVLSQLLSPAPSLFPQFNHDRERNKCGQPTGTIP